MENGLVIPHESLICLSLDCGIHSIFNNRVGWTRSLKWLFGILLPLHRTLSEEEMILIGVLGFQIVLNFIASFSWIKNNRAYLDLVELYNAGQKSIDYVKSFPLYPYIFCQPCLTFV